MNPPTPQPGSLTAAIDGLLEWMQSSPDELAAYADPWLARGDAMRAVYEAPDPEQT